VPAIPFNSFNATSSLRDFALPLDGAEEDFPPIIDGFGGTTQNVPAQHPVYPAIDQRNVVPHDRNIVPEAVAGANPRIRPNINPNAAAHQDVIQQNVFRPINRNHEHVAHPQVPQDVVDRRIPNIIFPALYQRQYLDEGRLAYNAAPPIRRYPNRGTGRNSDGNFYSRDDSGYRYFNRDGSRYYHNADGSSHFDNGRGFSRYTTRNGSRRYSNPDGSYGYRNPNGSTYYRSSDGYSRYTNPQGRSFERYDDFDSY
jgi:hypothetical protein